MAKLVEAIKDRYPNLGYLADMVLGKFPNDIEISDFTPLKADALRNYICSKVCSNSAITYFEYINCVLNLYGVDKSVRRQLTARFEDTVSVFLTEDEIDRIINYAENKQGMDRVTHTKRMYAYAFIISACSGMRASDMMDVSKENVCNGVLTYTSIKTGVTAQVPARKDILKWIATMKDMMTKYDFSDSLYRLRIKEVCKECGINSNVLIHRAGKNVKGEKWRFVSTHTARRSFATNLYLRGLDIYTIGKFLGHRANNITLTSKYICCTLKPLDSSIMGFFNR